MLIYTVKASRLKFFAVLLCSMAILLTLAAIVPTNQDLGSVAVVNYDYSDINTNADRIEFLTGFGYAVEETPVEITEVFVPVKFDSVYEKYNDVQRAQGLNLKRYAGKMLTRYTYKITNYSPEKPEVYANLLMNGSDIVAGDVYSSGDSSFLHGFEKKDT